MGFNDIFKSEFLSSFSSFSITDTLIALVLSFVIGLFITQIYKRTYSGVVYSGSFCVSLLGLCLITTFVILAVTSNVVLSLGMVGALSIVRFRAAIKEPLDIVYLFWSIAVGIVLGAGLIPLALIGSVILGIVLVVFSNTKGIDSPYILVLSLNVDSEQSVLNVLNSVVKKYKIKSKTLNSDGMDLNIEIRLKGNDTSFLNKLQAISGVNTCSLVSYNGDYMG